LSISAAAVAVGATAGSLSTPWAAATSSIPNGTAGDPRIRTFHVREPQNKLDELRRRVRATLWPDKEPVPDQTQGIQLATMQALAHFWATKYDWRQCEARINAFPNFMTEIDGVDIHFLHVRSKHENAMPLIVTHGWPGSIVEQLKIIEPLTNPTAHGGRASDAFHVVIPSIPGYGYSGKPTATGWDPQRVGRAWDVLMKRLGYTKYVAQGGDWGAIIVEVMGVQAPPGLLGIHTNLPDVVPPEVDAAVQTGGPLPPGLSTEEKNAADQLAFVYKHIAYARIMGDRPQTLTGLSDSPVGLAAFMLDHDKASLASITRTFEGVPGFGLSRTDILDNVTHFWLTNTGVSASRLFWENKTPFFAVKGIKIPVAVSVFPNEIYQAPRSWAVKAYPKLLRYNKVAAGGHFAAWEQPQLFSEEVRASFRSLR
jgi:pimeloyl-ACP methyl ester carboxylesterase